MPCTGLQAPQMHIRQDQEENLQELNEVEHDNGKENCEARYSRDINRSFASCNTSNVLEEVITNCTVDCFEVLGSSVLLVAFNTTMPPFLVTYYGTFIIFPRRKSVSQPQLLNHLQGETASKFPSVGGKRRHRRGACRSLCKD